VTYVNQVEIQVLQTETFEHGLDGATDVGDVLAHLACDKQVFTLEFGMVCEKLLDCLALFVLGTLNSGTLRARKGQIWHT